MNKLTFPTQKVPLTRRIALVSIFAAVYALVGVAPAFPIIGVPGAFISWAATMSPVIGFALGPLLAPLAVAIGGLAGSFLWPWVAIFGLFTFIPGTVAALIAGLCRYRKYLLSSLILASLIIAFQLHWLVSPYRYFVWAHVIGLILLLTFGKRASEYIDEAGLKLPLGIGILAFAATLSDQLTGSIIAHLIFGELIPPAIWKTVAFVYPVERLLIAIVAAIIGSALLRALRGLKVAF